MHPTAGCCSDYIGPDFTKMSFKKLQTMPCVTSHINWCEGNLLFSIAAICCLPAFYSIIYGNRWSLIPGVSPSAFVHIMAFTLNIFKLSKFVLMTMKQPRWDLLKNLWVVLAGYQLISLGVIFYLICLCAYGPYGTVFALDLKDGFRRPAIGKPIRLVSRATEGRYGPVTQRRRDLSKVLKTSAFCCHLGYSLISASQAGIMVAVLQVLAHTCGMTCF
ncbi:hypothetical protein ACOMHN_059988 [Nucella lapillus]